jgi:hypothetical protein
MSKSCTVLRTTTAAPLADEAGRWISSALRSGGVGGVTELLLWEEGARRRGWDWMALGRRSRRLERGDGRTSWSGRGGRRCSMAALKEESRE